MKALNVYFLMAVFVLLLDRLHIFSIFILIWTEKHGNERDMTSALLLMDQVGTTPGKLKTKMIPRTEISFRESLHPIFIQTGHFLTYSLHLILAYLLSTLHFFAPCL